jgi:hypothetical protein
VHCDEFGSAIRIGQGDRNRHLALQRRIRGLELDRFDNLLVRHEPEEATVMVSVCGVVVPVPVGASYVRETRNMPPSRASNMWTTLLMPGGTIHFATAPASRSER